MPVVALMLLGLVALQRRRPVLAGLALGAASSLKFTAWPLVVMALWAAYDLRTRRAIGRYAVGVVAVVVPVVVPVALRNPSAFIDNVVRFPLGLAGVSSPAASALPGHILISIFPALHRPYVAVAGVAGVVVLVRHLIRRPPRDSAEVASLTGWVMLIAILLAPATRVGYLLYPINLFVWAWMLRRSTDPAVPGEARPEADTGSTQTAVPWPSTLATSPPGTGPMVQPGADQLLSSDSSNSWRENGVIPAEVVGDTTVADLPVETVTASPLGQHLGANRPSLRARADVDHPPAETREEGSVQSHHLVRGQAGPEGDRAIELGRRSDQCSPCG